MPCSSAIATRGELRSSMIARRRKALGKCGWILLYLALVLSKVSQSQAQSVDVAIITNIVRTVEVARAGSPGRWDRASTDPQYSGLKSGDQVRTRLYSIAG